MEKSKKSKKSEVDEALDNFGGRYEKKYDEDGNVTWEKVASEEEVLNDLFSVMDENKSNETSEDAEEIDLLEMLKNLDKSIHETCDLRNDLIDEIIEAQSEFHKISYRTQELCVYDAYLSGIAFASNAFKDMLLAIILEEPVSAKSCMELMAELESIKKVYGKEI